MLACPYCHQPAMTIWKKLTIGPRHSVACRSCGKKITVSKAAILAIVVPVTAGALMAYASPSLTLGSVAILIGGAAAVGLYILAVPIVGRDA